MEKIPYQLESNPSESSSNGIASKKLHLIPLIFLIFFEVSGGPYGEEPAVAAAGPLFAILGFLIFPFIWSAPEALITAELATAFPGNGGFVIWADEAFGPFWGFQMGSLKFLSAVINNTAYPVNCVDYLKLVFKVLESGWPPKAAISVATLLLSFLNYTGLNIVGYTAVAFAVILLCPFILMALISAPKLHPLRWMSLGQKGVKKNWNLYFNTLFWNLNFWDNVSTLAGEVDRPQTNFPVALLSAVILASIGNLIPLFVITGSLTVDQNKWENGFFADAGGMVAGNWLKFWVELGAVLSAVGMFEASLSSSSFQLLDIISSANFLYSLGMLLEFASFIWLRRQHPNLNRPFKVPLGTPALICMLLVPTGFLIFLIAIATKVVYVVCSLLILLGVLGYFLMKLCKSRFWLDFTDKKIEELEEPEMTRLVPDKQ